MKTQNQAAYTLADLKAAAYGRWPEIHAALGIDPRYLNPRRHCPCPRCGGKDRYRYTDYQGRGGFICNQCSPEGGSGGRSSDARMALAAAAKSGSESQSVPSKSKAAA